MEKAQFRVLDTIAHSLQSSYSYYKRIADGSNNLNPRHEIGNSKIIRTLEIIPVPRDPFNEILFRGTAL